MARGHKPAFEVDFGKYAQARPWLQSQSTDLRLVVTVRAALRALPLIWQAWDIGDFSARVALPVFRAGSVAWTAAKYPLWLDRGANASVARAAAIAALRAAESTYAVSRSGATAAAGAAVDAAAYAASAVNSTDASAAGHAYSAAEAADLFTGFAYANATNAYAAARADAMASEEGMPLAEIINAPLWPNGMPGTVFEPWERLRSALLSSETEYWQPWVRWYEHVRDRGGSFGESFDVAVAALTDEQWNEEPCPAAVNKRIADLLAEYAPSDEIAPLSPGIPPSFALDQRSLQHWFGTQPPEVARTLACRAALRALPLLVSFWGRPDFQVLPLFRAAQASWARAVYPDSRINARASLSYLAENSHAGAALMFAEAVARPSPRNRVGDLAARAIRSAITAEEALADLSLEELVSIEAAGDFEARRAFAVDLAGKPLWPGALPYSVSSGWVNLERSLWSASDADWEFWIEWYNDRLKGLPSLGEAFDLAVATLPNELWEQGAVVVNARIKELIAEHTPSEPVPVQGVGPHFALGDSDKIALALPLDLDVGGNNIGRIRQQLPLVREAAEDLAGRLNPNAFSELARNLAAYRAAIEGEPETIAWGIVFARGVRLDNAAAAARRRIEDRLQPQLEDATQEALDSVMTLHGPLILATAEGRELMEIAGQMLLTREQLAAEREHAISVATALHEDKEVIELPAAEVVLAAVETMAQGPHPERGSAVGGATIKNAMIWTVGVGALASIAGVGFVQAGAALVAIEGLKKSKRFSALTEALGARIDGVLRTGTAFQNFVIRNEHQLRQMADNSPGMRWMLPHIDDIVKRNADKK